MHDVKAAHRIRVQTRRFSGKLSSGLPKVARRAVEEILYGIQARGSVKLSEIARSLGEDTSLKKVIKRLGRQLGRKGLREQVRENLLRQATRLVPSRFLSRVEEEGRGAVAAGDRHLRLSCSGSTTASTVQHDHLHQQEP